MQASPQFLLFLVFLVLKLAAVIDWSWWWVTAPLWGGFAFVALCLFVYWACDQIEKKTNPVVRAFKRYERALRKR